MSTNDPHLMSGAYAVDALDDAERTAFEAHLAECEDCRTEVAELKDTASRLATLAVSEPPASLRENVLAGIASTRQLPPDSSQVAGPAQHGEEGEDDAGSALPPIGRARSHWTQRFAMPAAAVVLGVLAMTAGVWGLNQRDRADELSARADLVSSVLTAPDASSSSAKLGAGRASVVVSPTEDRAVMVASGLDAPADGQVYQLWRVDGSGQAASAGTYVPSTDGVVAVALDGSLAGTKTVAVTIEPAGGSKQPTSAPIGAFAL